LASQAVFERNLAALRRRHPELARSLETASTEGVEEEVGPRGARILKQNGIRLGSAYDPEREGRQIAGEMAAEPADLMIAVGFGLGEQFEPYLAQNPGTLIIYEPCLARLKAALERLPISNLLATNRDLYVCNDLDTFRHVFSARYAPGLRVRVFPHPAMARLDRKSLAEIVELTRFAKEVVDTQRLTAIHMLMPWALLTAQNGQRIAQNPQIGILENAFQDRPAVIVAAGPSLDKQLDLLRTIRDRVLVIAIGQTARALRTAGIEPDIVHLLESQDVSHQLTESGDTSSLVVAATPDAHPAIFDVPARARFTVTTGGGEMGVWIAKATGESRFTMGGGTVAQGAVGIGVLLGCNPIALIGQDLAFSEGRVYASNSAYDFIEVDVSDPENCRFSNMDRKVALVHRDPEAVMSKPRPRRRVVWVDGWNEGEKVPTYRAYASFLDQYREMGIGLRARGWRLINCTEGGARIPELEHRTFRSFAEEFATEAIDARARILEAHDQAPRFTLADYADAIRDAEKALDRLERESRKGLRFLQRGTDRLRTARSEQQRIEILRGVARFEKRIRRQLDQVPWLDALVQPEIYRSMATARQTERLDPTDEQLVEESTFLFEAVKNGTQRGRVWLETFQTSFASADQPSAEPVAPEREHAPVSMR
jgi:hypothetical protein